MRTVWLIYNHHNDGSETCLLAFATLAKAQDHVLNLSGQAKRLLGIKGQSIVEIPVHEE